jgi:hypothetical protein
MEEEREACESPAMAKAVDAGCTVVFTRCTEGNGNAFRHDHSTTEAIAFDARLAQIRIARTLE